MKIFVLSRRAKLPAAAVLTALLIVLGLTAPPHAATVSGSADGLLPVYEVATAENAVAISFDASWGAEYTPLILDILDEYGAHATFFLVNIWLASYPDMAREIALRGQEIGMHSATHPHFSHLTEEQMREELTANRQLVLDTTGYTPRLFRPPFGDYDGRVVELVHEMGCECVQWSVDSLDWQDLGAQEIYRRVTADIHGGDIVLFHNNGLHTAEALPLILECFKQKGLRAVSVSELLPEGDTFVDSNGVQHCK
ncbi:MAG: polysaccharide deacetylase family protein [Firmicutes bacterium]|nr:polysaccharide deacetylase family protein [Bacillota bacterium]